MEKKTDSTKLVTSSRQKKENGVKDLVLTVLKCNRIMHCETFIQHIFKYLQDILLILMKIRQYRHQLYHTTGKNKQIILEINLKHSQKQLHGTMNENGG